LAFLLLVPQVIGRYPLPGCGGSHGLNIDSEHRLAFVACEENAELAVFDIEAKKMTEKLVSAHQRLKLQLRLR
jgi:hypothetical protein